MKQVQMNSFRKEALWRWFFFHIPETIHTEIMEFDMSYTKSEFLSWISKL